MKLDLAERIQGVSFSCLETFKNLIFEERESLNQPYRVARNRGGHDFGVQLDLAETIQNLTFSSLETFKNLIFEPLKV